MAPPKKPEEFAGTLGDRQVRGGGTRIMALTRAPSIPNPPARTVKEILAKAAATVSDDRQVISAFDTRPIDAFDFVFSFVIKPVAAGGEPGFESVELPVGYVAVLRRVELTIFPPYAGTDETDPLQVRLMRSDSSIPSNDIQLFGNVESYAWDTHQVYGYWEKPGLWVQVPGDVTSYSFGVRFLGTLLLAKNIPPSREIGSPTIHTTK